MDTNLLDLYTDYLLVSTSQASATGMSRMLDGSLSHDQITRFLSGEDFSSKDLWKLVKSTVREVEREGGKRFILLDDTVEAKPYTKENSLICWHRRATPYDHTTGKSVKGVNQLSCLFYSCEVSLPIGVEFVEKDLRYIDSRGRCKRRSSVSKQELFRRLVGQANTNLAQINYVLADSWRPPLRFCCAENMQFIKQYCKADFIMPLKANRKVALSTHDQQAGKYKRLYSLDLQEGESGRIYLEQSDCRSS